MRNKKMKKIISITLLFLAILLSFVGCGKKEIVTNTIVVNGKIISNDKINDAGLYKNIIELEDGELWEYESVNKIVQTDKEQFINKGNPNDIPDVVLIRIAPK